MILTLISCPDTCASMLKSAAHLAVCLGKPWGIGLIGEQHQRFKEHFSLENLDMATPDFIECFSTKETIDQICNQTEASFLFIQTISIQHRNVFITLKQCRELRIPYVFYPNNLDSISFQKMLVPMGFLMEELEKSHIAAVFGRRCQTDITFLQAKDYGSRAKKNIEKACNVLDKFQLTYHIIQGRKNSFKIEFEAIKTAKTDGFDVVLVCASREYGLDDIFFGPKELHLIRKSIVPVVLLNPRADLYVLCE